MFVCVIEIVGINSKNDQSNTYHIEYTEMKTTEWIRSQSRYPRRRRVVEAHTSERVNTDVHKFQFFLLIFFLRKKNDKQNTQKFFVSFQWQRNYKGN